MPIWKLIGDRSFDAEQLTGVSAGFDAACRGLGLADKADKATKLVAEKVIEIVSSAERDPDKLRNAVLSAFNVKN
jgi:hypothetical protein